MKTSLAIAAPTSEDAPVTAASVVPIVGAGVDGSPLLQVDGDTLVAARLAVRLSRPRLWAAVTRGQPAVVVYEDGDRLRPIVVGLLEPPPGSVPLDGDAGRGALTRAGTPPCIDADVDGSRVRLTARDEIVLQCGEASITLRRNGRVVIRGTYVETRSDGTNRIKGGQVQIN